MGRVWAARQVGSPLQRLVAVKTAISGQSQTAEFQRLFMDEARIASLILHPHVCGVYELGEDKGVMYLVMEWCDGSSLRQVMDQVKGRMDLAVAVRIVASVAAGLHAAHELEDNDGTKLRVVHRDVSPQNILISKNGHVKVADFGVAKAQGQLHRPTETGEMKGKLAYMAPEQVTAKEVDQRADVFALGCVLYESTVGRRPFHGEGALSTLYQLLEQSVTAPKELVPDYPAELSAIVLKALAKDPVERYQTAEEMRVALEGWLARSGNMATERTIAELMQQTVGKEIEEKSARISEAIRNLPMSKEAPRQEQSAPPPATSASAPPPKVGASTEDRGVATGSTRREKSSWLMPALATAGVLAVVLVLARGSLSPQPATASVGSKPNAAQATEPEPKAAATPPAQPTARPETVRINLRTVPEEATIRIDEGPALASPYVGQVLSTTNPRVIEVSAEGYVSERRTVTFDRDQELLMQLEPIPGKAQPRTARDRRNPRGRTEPAAAQPVNPVQPVGTVATEPVMERRPKKPRTLDTDNPFAGG
jgi:eukaryotic-like serine/threonine-protein kinase